MTAKSLLKGRSVCQLLVQRGELNVGEE